jgi:thioredoxin 2
MASTTVVTCPNCGRKNRVASAQEGVPRCGNCHNALPWIVDSDADSFDRDVASTLPVLVDFWAPWCGPCRVVAPVLEEIASERPDLRVVKLNIDDNQQTAASFQVLSIPTLILFKGGQAVKTVIGAYPKKRLEQELEPDLTAA